MTLSTAHRLASLVVLLAVTTSAKEQTRWSRQISSYTSDISDWVPLAGPVEREPSLPPIKRQAIAEPRILTEPFPTLTNQFGSDLYPIRTFYNSPANRQLYLQSVPSVPSAPQNFLTDQGFGHSIRFGLSQPNFPLNQGFVSPQFGFENVPQLKPQRPQVAPNPVKFESFPKPTPHQPVQSPVPTPAKTFFNQAQRIRPEVPKYTNTNGYRVENASNDFSFNQKKKPQSLQKIKFDSFDKPLARPEVPLNAAVPQQNSQKSEREEVQLLYVPLESLNRGQFNTRNQITNTQILNPDPYTQGVQTPVKKSMSELHKPIQSVEPSLVQNYFSDFNSQLKGQDQVPKFSTISSPFPVAAPTTPKPKKLKPHQPPLAIFLTEKASKGTQIKVADVLSSLKTANSVAVLDSVNPSTAPEVFIGPSSLQPPARYVKFELPYLSNIENSDKKLRQLPFFVAPLSYNTPQGFAKIPFPSPHVGSVVINSQIKETTQTDNVTPNYYSGTYKQEQTPITQKPTVSYYTASPKTNTPSNYQSNYYQFEPQTVSTLRPLKESESVPPRSGNTGNYFVSNTRPQYDSQNYNFAQQQNYQQQSEVVKPYKQETTTTQRTTVSTTSKPPSTYPSQLLETHNPYSINQAFHFSTPLDYQTYSDDYKQSGAAPGQESNRGAAPQREQIYPNQAPKAEDVVTERQVYQSSPNYLQNYNPEIHYESEGQSPRYPAYNTNEYSQKHQSSESYNAAPVNNEYNIPANQPAEYTETQAPVQNENIVDEITKDQGSAEVQNSQKYDYKRYETTVDNSETEAPSTSSTTSTTNRRTPLRGRGRPRYTTTPRSESSEYTTKTTVTRRPLRERKPLPTRSRYEPNKITTEKPTRKPVEYTIEESSTRATRTRTRGRVTYKPSEENYGRKSSSGKEQDLAYQRDVLHQNYPVTIQERMSTVDIEAMTEPTAKEDFNDKFEPVTEIYDTENAYTNEKAAIAEQPVNEDTSDDIPIFPSRTTVSQSETSYVPRLSTRNEDYAFNSRSSQAPVQSVSYDETAPDREENNYQKLTTPVQKEPESFITETTTPIIEQNEQVSQEIEYKEERITTTSPEPETTKVSETVDEEEENVVQTTPSYNRVRVRPGVVRQYHQASSTESSKIKTDRRRLSVTYRPAFDRRRTTMRIDEIQADLKTKQVHGRLSDDRHPVYKPDPSPSTEATSTQDSTTKRGQFRRRRPSYSVSTTSSPTTTSTSSESPVTRKNTFEIKNRFRGRRPSTERPTEKTEAPIEVSTTSTTVRPLYSRFSHRPRLSDRYTKKPATTTEEPSDDQDSNFSVNRPKYVEPETEQWSPKLSSDSFTPYNPNNVEDDDKIATTERRSDKIETDIITARNDYDDVLLTVTPASNNRNNKKIPDIPPTLEALVEQSKVTKSDTNDNMSNFESMLEEVMKSLEEQDENEYSSTVMKHKGGEIGEIPPEKVITFDDHAVKQTTSMQSEVTTVAPEVITSPLVNEEEKQNKGRRRGYYKKVKTRPVAAESIEVAESQYYSTSMNQLGQTIPTKAVHEKSAEEKKTESYNPTVEYMKDLFSSEDITSSDEVVPTLEISKVNAKVNSDVPTAVLDSRTEVNSDSDSGTGSPDPTLDDLYNTSTEQTTTVKSEDTQSHTFSFMEYFFGMTDDKTDSKNETVTEQQSKVEITTDAKTKLPTTETSFIPDEMTEASEINTESIEIKKVESKESDGDETTKPSLQIATQSTFMDPSNAMSTSMSTEISHETEICFRGKCIKSYKNV